MSAYNRLFSISAIYGESICSAFVYVKTPSRGLKLYLTFRSIIRCSFWFISITFCLFMIFHQFSISVFMLVFQNWCSPVSKPQSLVLFGARSDQVWKQWSAKLLANASKLV